MATVILKRKMSEENLKIVQELGDAYFRGDQQAMLELVDPDVVVTQFPDQPDARLTTGTKEC